MRATVISGNDPALPCLLRSLFEEGGVLIFPTDTVLGIGGDPYNEGTVARVREIKGRPEGQPFSLHLPELASVKRFARLDDRMWRSLACFLPGPYTFLLSAAAKAPRSATKEGKVGVRVPDHPFFSRVMAGLERPLFGTSVNRSGEPPLAGLEKVIDRFANAVDLIVTGRAGSNRPSSVIDLTVFPPKALRGDLPMGLE